MLAEYEGNTVRIQTEEGIELAGVAEVFSSGFAMREFGRKEPGICINGTCIFRSQIHDIQIIETSYVSESERYENIIQHLLERNCWIVDVLPKRVPEKAEGRYFAVEKYYTKPERLAELYRRYGEIILRLNCYWDMAVSCDDCQSWENDPDPEQFISLISDPQEKGFMRILFPSQKAMIDLDKGDTWLTVYYSGPDFRNTLKSLAEAEGFFVWEGQ